MEKLIRKPVLEATVSPSSSGAETRLIADVLLGDRKAIADFVDQYSDAVFRFVRRRVDDPSLVEDIAQEVFLVAWSKLESFEGRSSLQTWLCAIAHNKIIDLYRKQIRELPLFENGDEQDGVLIDTPLLSIEDGLDQRLLEASVRHTMSRLPERYRAILRWRYWEERSLRELAVETEKTAKSLERLLARARIEFAARWKEGWRG